MTDHGADGVFVRERRALTAGVVLTISLIAFEGIAVATILPVVAGDLGGLRDYGWAFSAFMLANLVGTVSAGHLADRRGPRQPFILAVACFGLGLVVASAAPHWYVLIVGRVLQGFGGGALLTVAYVAIQRGYPEALRPRMLALVSTSWTLPALTGPALAGAAAEHLTWRLVFGGLLPLLALALALVVPMMGALGMPTGVGRATGRTRTAVKLALGTALLLAGIGQIGRPVIALGLCIVGAVIAGPALHALLPQGSLLLRVGLPSAVGLRGLLSYVFFGTEAFVPLGLTSLHAVGAARAGLTLSAGALSWIAGAWLQERIEHRRGARSRRPRAMLGAGCVALGVVLVAICVLTPRTGLASVIASWSIAGFGMGLSYPTAAVTALATVPDTEAGATSSSLHLSEALAVALGAGLGGAALRVGEAAGFELRTRLACAFFLAIVPAPLAIVAAFRLNSMAEHARSKGV